MNPQIQPEEDFFGSIEFPAGASRLSYEDQLALKRAMFELERTNLAVRLSTILGWRVSALGTILPANITEVANRAAENAVRAGLNFALRSLAGKPVRDRRRLHNRVATLAGAAGGALGLASLPIELPFSTLIMLRAIADIGRTEGEDLSDHRTVLACLEVFAIGSRTEFPDATYPVKSSTQSGEFEEGVRIETGYFALRAILAKSVSEAASYIAGRRALQESAPVMARLVTQIGSHFGVAVSQKFVAQSVPLIGAACGAAINFAFADHFQTIARGHFTILRLERRYGARTIRMEYERIRREWVM